MPMMDSQRAGVISVLDSETAGCAMRLLILGGTTEASTLARILAADARFETTLSYAGRTANPRAQPIPSRIGGFGGAAGLARWLADEKIAAVVDATHPFACRISGNAVEACQRLAIPLVSIVRPAWQPQPGDRWIPVGSAAEAAKTLGSEPQRVFLTVGRLELTAFADAPQHLYLARSIDPPGDIALPPKIRFLFQRGPFDAESEAALLIRDRIAVLVSKNSGGSATYGKIEAARRLGLPIVMIERPAKPAGHAVADADAAYRWLDDLRSRHVGSRSERGV
jgi:precorrin-6A/cobalt-precorrin-6A reductase